ncbi:MAG TPA: hypothetical protein VE861_01005 [Gemmatimonadaceae bacterium]|nr:hypothetical protein [Gemmatimonadaceae bacterium]
MSAPPFSIAILGNDAFLAASPAAPVQLMHAALAAGFDSVVPASLGDELVAGETLRIAQLRSRRPVVQCSCPFALTQLCKREANLADITVAVAPAAVALARALRLEHTAALHLTYIGGCPGAQDPDIDLQVSPEAFLRGLTRKGIDVSAQPDVFTDRLPPDRRRYLSLPGGAPRAELVETLLRRNVVTLTARSNPMLTVADALFDGGVTLIDPAGAYNCVCAGARADGTVSVADGRLAIARLEPVRASSPIFEAPAWLDLRPSDVPLQHGVAGEPIVERRAAAFSDASRFTSTDRPESTAAPSSSPAAESSRRMYALGVRSSRRRAPLATSDAATMQQAAIEEHIPPTSPLLHATPIEREVPIAEPLAPVADRVAGSDPAATRRPPVIDELFRRD